jgi:hypothetical protein
MIPFCSLDPGISFHYYNHFILFSLSFCLSLSSSEANDLALSIAEAFTGHTQVIALDGYHILRIANNLH